MLDKALCVSLLYKVSVRVLVLSYAMFFCSLEVLGIENGKFSMNETKLNLVLSKKRKGHNMG